MPYVVSPTYCLINPNDSGMDIPEGLGYGKVIEVAAGVTFPIVNSFVMYVIENAKVRPGFTTPNTMRLYLPIGDIVAVKV